LIHFCLFQVTRLQKLVMYTKLRFITGQTLVEVTLTTGKAPHMEC
jgi:hypothetical protein